MHDPTIIQPSVVVLSTLPLSEDTVESVSSQGETLRDESIESRVSTVVLVLRAHRIQGTLGENQGVLLLVYYVKAPSTTGPKLRAHPHSMCSEDQNYGTYPTSRLEDTGSTTSTIFHQN